MGVFCSSLVLYGTHRNSANLSLILRWTSLLSLKFSRLERRHQYERKRKADADSVGEIVEEALQRGLKRIRMELQSSAPASPPVQSSSAPPPVQSSSGPSPAAATIRALTSNYQVRNSLIFSV